MKFEFFLLTTDVKFFMTTNMFLEKSTYSTPKFINLLSHLGSNLSYYYLSLLCKTDKKGMFYFPNYCLKMWTDMSQITVYSTEISIEEMLVDGRCLFT